MKSKLLLLFLSLFAFVGGVKARDIITDVIYARLNASATPTGAGRVYVNDKENTADQNQEVIATTNSQRFTFAISTTANPGWKFTNWTADEGVNLTNPNSPQTNAAFDATAKNNEKNPTTKNVVAHFEEITVTNVLADWTAPQGNGPAYYLSTDAVETYAGDNTNFAVGKVLYQKLENLKNGYYTIGFYASAQHARGANVNSGTGIAQKYVTTAEGTVATNMTVWDESGIAPEDSKWYQEFTIHVTDGTLEYGLRNVAEGGNWYVCKAARLEYHGETFNNTYTRDNLTVGSFGTICLPYAVSVTNFEGATIHKIVGKRVDANGAATSIVYEDVADDGVLEAGVPYIFIAESEQITATYTLGAKAAAGKSENGLHGTLVRYAFEDDPNYKDGEYYVINSNNEFQRASSKSGVVAFRAFVKMSEVPEYEDEDAAHSVKVMRDNLETGLNAVEVSKTHVVYDLQGRRVNNPANGLYIVNGKQVYIK